MVNFDESQKLVVNHVSGALLVVAGAGSGKTATIIGRAARLIIHHRIEPSQQLLLTFSKRAADEMKSRLAVQLPGISLAGIFVGTFHAFGYKLIRERPILCQRRQGVTVMDAPDSRSMLKAILDDIGAGDSHSKQHVLLDTLQSSYRSCCNELLPISSDHLKTQILSVLESNGLQSHQLELFFRVFRDYEQRKRAQNVVDFDDLVSLPAVALQSSEEGHLWGRELAQRLRYITVDEVQDTNTAQCVLLIGIGQHNNIVIVGDDDQSVYGWRGARPGNMQALQARLHAKVIFLERNYRTTSSIVQVASGHIARNVNRFKKSCYSMQGDGSPLQIMTAPRASFAVKCMVDNIQLHVRAGGSWRDVAVLYRVNRLSGLLVQEMRRRGIPYKVAGGVLFEERKEVRIVLALARLVLNESDGAALRTVSEVIPGLGCAGVEKLISTMGESGAGLLTTVAHVVPKAKGGILALAAVLRRLKCTGPISLCDLAVSREGLDLAGYFYGKEPPETANARINNLHFLQSMINGWVDGSDRGWEVIFEKLLGAATVKTQMRDQVTLSTIHRAKGLEFEIAHVFGFSDGLLPLAKKNEPHSFADDLKHMEEERRLSYVAMTRARSRCILWHCDLYDLGGSTSQLAPSRFISEFNPAAT